MKKLCYIALIALANAWAGRAQTNAAADANTTTNATTNAVGQILALVTTNPPPAKPKPSEIIIESDGPAEFRQVDHGVRVTYRDNVRLNSPNLKLQCEWLLADFAQSSGHPTNVLAETNVVIDATDDKGQKIHATGDKAVYVYNMHDSRTNETVTLTSQTGEAEAKYKQMTLKGSPIILDLSDHAHPVLYAPPGSKTIVYGNFGNNTSGTNSMIVGTNMPVTANPAIAETNLPPAKNHLPSATNSQPPESK